MSNLVEVSVNLRNQLQNSNWDIESLMRLYCKTTKAIQFAVDLYTSSDFGCPITPIKRKKYERIAVRGRY